MQNFSHIKDGDMILKAYMWLCLPWTFSVLSFPFSTTPTYDMQYIKIQINQDSTNPNILSNQIMLETLVDLIRHAPSVYNP